MRVFGLKKRRTEGESSKASSLPTIFSRNVRNQQNNTACYLARRISKPLLFVALGNALTVWRQESRLTDLQKAVTNADNHEYFAEKIHSFLIVLLVYHQNDNGWRGIPSGRLMIIVRIRSHPNLITG